MGNGTSCVFVMLLIIVNQSKNQQIKNSIAEQLIGYGVVGFTTVSTWQGSNLCEQAKGVVAKPNTPHKLQAAIEAVKLRKN